MSSAPLAKKLLVRPGSRLLVLNAPDGYLVALALLPDGASVTETPAKAGFDVVQLFARNQAELASLAPTALAALKRGGVLWGCYPKGSSKVQTDLTRDHGWDAFTNAGWEVVSAISIDATWSGSRFRHRDEARR